MTRKRLNELLKEYANTTYWYGENYGEYGKPDPKVHKQVESEIWKVIKNKKK